MGIPRFFKQAGHRRFNYSPLYWDPDKEDREQRIRAIKQEMGVEVELGRTPSTIKRGSFRRNVSSSKIRSRASRDSNRRLLLIVAVLLLLAYILVIR